MESKFLENYYKQKKTMRGIPESSAYYIDGEWKHVVENVLNNLIDKIPSYKEQDFYNIMHVASETEIERHKYISEEILSKISLNNKKSDIIVEIGAGIGGVCANLLKSMSEKKTKYIIFDIPEVLLISSCFIDKILGEKFKIFSYEGGEINIKNILKQYDILFLPHFLVDKLPNNFCNVFINTGSFCEMPERTYRFYMDKILQCLKNNSICYFEYRKKDLLVYYQEKNEIDVEPYLDDNLKIISKEITKYNSTYWGSFYEN